MKILPPKHCPACASELQLVNFQLFCKNTLCEAQTSKKVEAYAKKMKIKGLGPKSIEKLGLESIPEVYTLTGAELTDTLGRVGTNIFDNIQLTKTSNFATFLSALSIPLIGNTAANKIGELVNSLSGIVRPALTKAGIGDKASTSILYWLSLNMETYSNLPIVFDAIKDKKPRTKSLGAVCITGRLNDYKNRTIAGAALEECGYTVVNTVNSRTKYLVEEQGNPSSKVAKATSLNIPLTTMQQLLTAAGESNNVQ